MSDAIPFAEWTPRLNSLLGERWRVRCVEACDSTQDEAADEPPGTVVVAWRQCAGRGRLGRAWHDTGTEGVALTVALPVALGPERLDRLSVAAGLAVAMAIESLSDGTPVGGRRVHVKWPNDVQIDGLKIAGVLIEASSDRVRLGIGINVGQRDWPPPLRGVATSLVECGVHVDRLDVIVATLARLHDALSWDDAALRREFALRDALVGTVRSVRVGDQAHRGIIEAIDPFASIRLRHDDGVVVEIDARLALVDPMAPSAVSDRQ